MSEQMQPSDKARTERIVNSLQAVAKQTGRSAAEVALAWLSHRDVRVIPIIGARKLEQLKSNMAAAELQLSADQIKTLDQASQIELGFPHDFYNKEMVRNFIYGGTRDSIVV